MTDSAAPLVRSPITRWLAGANPVAFTFYAVVASFATYFCMYAFRKPFSAGTYQDLTFGLDWASLNIHFQVNLKTAFITSQILGYTLSKFIGIKVCSEITRARRAVAIIGLILAAQLMLLLFAVVPPNWKVVAIFFNGLPLGMVWGLVVAYLEGRRTSEALLAGLSCSFILASGIVKDIGKNLMAGAEKLNIFGINVPWLGQQRLTVPNPLASFGRISEFWMPFAVGLLFVLPLLAAVLMLEQIPQPSQVDEKLRVKREPMDRRHRLAFFFHFLPGMVMLLMAYCFLTAFRDFRDNFGVEIFQGLGYAQEPDIFSRSESWVMFGVLGALAALVFVRSNRWGLLGAFFIMLTGTVMLGAGTLLLDAGRISGLSFMILTGLGVYLAYVPYGSVLFDRMIAYTGVVGTAVFAINLADFVGYSGSIVTMQVKDLAFPHISHLAFLRGFSYFLSVFAGLNLVASCVYFVYFHRHGRHADELDAAKKLAAQQQLAKQTTEA